VGRLGAAGGVLVAAVVLAIAAGAAALPADDAIVPLDATSPESRPLAQAYAEDLRALHAAVAGCAPALDVQRHGIGFRRPRGTAGGVPSLTLWVWLDPDHPRAGRSFDARASDAFARYGQPLFARLLGRSRIFADDRVGGYVLVLTWLSPAQRGGRLVGESLAVFADKLAAANFVHGTIGPATFLGRAQVRAFDGETELAPPSLALDDGAAPPALPC
jgi:hypothetical protein